ncbi:kynurenine 3-monooxygenase, mitochondrial precursor [Cryptotrichosporon argae]
MTTSPAHRPRTALVVGAGPVGALIALCLHRRGWDVEIWDIRDDPRHRDVQMANLRSINLNLSSRGLAAIRSVDPSVLEGIMDEAIPMKARMIHALDGSQDSQLYDPRGGQTGFSISRSLLNQRLLEALPPAIRTRFNTKLARLDLHACVAYAESARKPVDVGDEHGDGKSGKDEPDGQADKGTNFDLVVGADGSWSKVRAEMMRVERVDFSQSFIPHAYIELHMPTDPTKPGGFAIDPHHLHIWPRHAFMMIALANKDGSFTLTLFLPFAALEPLHSRDDHARFLAEHFPSVLEIVGDRLVDDFCGNPRGNLVTINVSPLAWKSHAVLLGDSAHSMVPFYGQGLNCGLEDVRVLNAYLENFHVGATVDDETDTLAAALAAYSAGREPDLRAICQLAMDNYTEMRSHVLSPLHHLRRHLDYALGSLLPSRPAGPMSLTVPFPTQKVSGWTGLYEMVTFRADVGYAEALRRSRWETDVVRRGVQVVTAAVIVGAGIAGWGVWKRR